MRNIFQLSKKTFLVGLGSLSLFLGLLGIFLPVLPTTPFLLLSAFCFSKSSLVLHSKLMNSKYLGAYIQDWQKHKSLPLRTKTLALALLWITTGSSILFFIPLLFAKIVVGIVCISVTVYLLKIPTRSK